jgi:exo-1,4-beta-D-glucosaminidase
MFGAGWWMQASSKVTEDGATLSLPRRAPRDWHPTVVPTTVLGALVRNGVYRDIFFSKNLESVDSRPFEEPWWFRKSFELPEDSDGRTARLIFEGINYRADVFLNGNRIASADETYGAFRMFEFDVTTALRKGENALAVRVAPPKPGDFTIGFVDWAPRPPDRNMGLYRPVLLRFSGPVSVERPFVETRLDLDTLAEARLTVRAILANHADRELSATVRGEFDAVSFARDIDLKPRERRPIEFAPEDSPALVVKNPRVWWPNGLGNPELYQMSLAASVGGRISDRRSVVFGVREADDYINEQGHRGFKINGRPLLVRGAGWADHLLLDEKPDNLETQFRSLVASCASRRRDRRRQLLLAFVQIRRPRRRGHDVVLYARQGIRRSDRSPRHASGGAAARLPRRGKRLGHRDDGDARKSGANAGVLRRDQDRRRSFGAGYRSRLLG